MDAILNARKTTLTNLPYSASATTLTVTDNDFTDADADFNLVIYDRTAGDVVEARKSGRFEIVRVSHEDMDGNDLEVTRGQEGTTAIEFTDSGDWQVILAPTRKVFEDIFTALGGKVNNNDGRLTNSREWTASTVSQSEAQAGTSTTRRAWTAQRVRQAVEAGTEGKVNNNDSRLTNAREWTASTVSQSEAQAGTSTTRRAWTAQRVRQAITSWWNSVTTKNGPLTISSPGYNEHLTLKRADLEVSLAPSTGSNSGTSPEMRFTAPTAGDVPGWWFDGRVSAKDGFYIEATRKDTVWDAKVNNNDSRLTNAREWTASTVTQAQAQAGTSTTRLAWTPQRVRQAIERLSGSRAATSDTGVVTNSASEQVNASHTGRAQGGYSQVNATTDGCIASGERSQVNASVNSEAHQVNTQINASYATRSGGADWNCSLWGYHSNPLSEMTPDNRTIRLSARDGNIQISGSVSSGHNFGDYAEFFENGTGAEIEPGILVKLVGDQVFPAEPGDDAIGVVSATAGIILGASNFCWHGRYLKDEWGRSIMEDIPDPLWKPKDGETEADRPIISVRKENPEWDPTQEQIPREDRPDEWTVVGLLGQVLVRADDDVQVNDYIKPSTNNVATTSTEKTNLRVMRETQEFDSEKGYKIVLCLLK